MPRITSHNDAEEELEKQRLDKELDDELENTFPASDPLKVTRQKPVKGRDRLAPTVEQPLEVQPAAEQLLLATQRLAALGEMTGGIAHDFRNLLAVIESGLRLAERNLSEPEKVGAYIAAIREAINRGSELTSQMLAFAKHQKLDAHAGNVNQFLQTFAPILRYGAGPNIQLDLELAPDVPTCLLDPAFFDAAILNLVTNARDAMSSGGRIDICTERFVQDTEMPRSLAPGAYARVSVKDSGQGMTPEELTKVFDPFFTTKGDKGTGIGLPQVRAFTQMVGGHVSIASRPGIGTMVDLFFPSLD